MIQAILDMMQNTLRHWGLTDFVLGYVTSLEPLRVQIGDGLFLEKENLIATTALGVLEKGDRLIVLRVLRGQKYILLSKEVAL